MKYELTTTSRIVDGAEFSRIRAVKDIDGAGVQAGELGGWVANPSNLSQDGDCWVYPNGMIGGGARVLDDSRVEDCAFVTSNAVVRDVVVVQGSSIITDNASISGSAVVTGSAYIFGDARIECGEDGPNVPSGAVFDFDLSYGNEMVWVSFGDDDALSVAVSQSGRICVSGVGRETLSGGVEVLEAVDSTYRRPVVAFVEQYLSCQ